MARIFTLSFSFKEQFYTALVSVCTKESHNISFKVHLYDESLYDLLPEGKLNFNIKEGLTAPVILKNALAEELVSCITGSISKYLDNDYGQEERLNNTKHKNNLAGKQ